VLTAARRAARDQFEEKRSLSLESKEASDSIQHAEDVARILRENVVQGKAVEGKENSYGMSTRPFRVSTKLTFWTELRIHEHTERGDNESIKMGAKEMGSLAGIKCS